MASPQPAQEPESAAAAAPQRFWVAGADRQPRGPFTIDEIRAMVLAGQLDATVLVRSIVGEAWVPLTAVLLAANSAPGVPPQFLVPQQPHDETMASLIPYRNGPALIGYYLSVFSLILAIFIPVLGGIVGGGVSMGFGFAGRRRAKANPTAKGAVHAWVAIALGGVEVLMGLGWLTVIVVAIAHSK